MKVEFSKKTIQKLKKKLEQAKKWNNVKLTMKVLGLLMLALETPMEKIAELLGITERTIYNWRNELLEKGVRGLSAKRGKGCPAKLSQKQKEELEQIVLDGPEKEGFLRGTWTAAMIATVIEKKYKVSYNRRYVCDLLKQIGLSYQKSKYISDKCDVEKRILWKDQTWPNLLERAKKDKAAILFEDEVGFALWGSLGYTWGLKGKQPLVKTSGKRKNLKAFGVIDYFTGRFVFQTEENRLNSDSYIRFLKKVLQRFTGNIILVHDGVSYHNSKDTKEFFKSQPRLQTISLPPYSPEINIIEYLWKKAKAKTHNKYFSNFRSLKTYVQKVLRSLQQNLSEVLSLCSSYPGMLSASVLSAS